MSKLGRYLEIGRMITEGRIGPVMIQAIKDGRVGIREVHPSSSEQEATDTRTEDEIIEAVAEMGVMYRFLDIGRMIQDGRLGKELAVAIIEDRVEIADFPTLMTLEIGTHTPEELVRALEESEYKMDLGVDKYILDKTFRVSTEKRTIELVVVTPEELGMFDWERIAFEDVCKQAKKKGLELCPHDVGPLARLKYSDQLMPGEDLVRGKTALVIAMKPVRRDAFQLVHNEISGKAIYTRSLDVKFCPWDKLVFCRRKKAA
ncbi:hypothetical protein KJ937_01050 [Patescibacteria group bacterium]|nr:hypothetical protein [Patescibacteria group bacterium]MBU2509243.1 hypothetical protein [Patescibacteria group bacterium]